jgi:hypothetical protein
MDRRPGFLSGPLCRHSLADGTTGFALLKAAATSTSGPGTFSTAVDSDVELADGAGNALIVDADGVMLAAFPAFAWYYLVIYIL